MNRCETCEVDIPKGDEAKELHESGKRHMKIRAQKEAAHSLAESSVFVKWKTQFPVTDELLQSAFGQFGRIDRILLRAERMYAIVEFSEKSSAEKAIQMGILMICEVQVNIDKRKVEFTPLKISKPQLDVQQAVQSLSILPSFLEQCDGLIHLMVLSKQELIHRQNFCSRLEKALDDYMLNPKIVLFGSSITGIGTIDSDIDATVFIEDSDTVSTDLFRDKYTLLTCDASLFKCRKITYGELMRLSSADRVRLVSKVINEVRKTAGWIGHQRPVLDARCPVVRFFVKEQYMIDLSVENVLGVQKSAYLKCLIAADISGNLQRILIAFRFWSLSNGLFEPPANQHVGHFNAYVLNLFVIYYLMLHHQIPEYDNISAIKGNPKQSDDSVKSSRWYDEYQIPSFNLGDLDLVQFFKKFFIDTVGENFPDVVMGPVVGVAMKKENFEASYLENEKFPQFRLAKLSNMNILDPVEPSHNTAQNITDKMVALMKKKMMFSLAAMKKNKGYLLTDIIAVDSRPSSCIDHPMSSVDHSFQLPRSINLKLHNLKRVICAIFEEIMLWDLKNLNEPHFKRMKLQDEEDSHLWTSGNYGIKFPLWIGRRNAKRKIQQQQPDLAFLQLEKQVSDELVKSYITMTDIAVVQAVIYLQDPETAFLGIKRIEGSPAEITNAWHFITTLISNNWSQIVSMF